MAGCGDSTDEISSELNNSSANQSTQDGEQIHSDSNFSKSKKEYLKKLNEMEESDKNIEAGTTMVELNEQASERYKKWDTQLNEIYEGLKAQLSPEQMDKLREEQRDWIKHRDKTAKEASLKYEGGSMEPLEYVTTQANLTKDRCYELVEKYMK